MSSAIKIVLMGEGGVGKTAMVTRYTTGRFDGKKYLPTIGDMYTKDIEVLGAPRHIEIDDTAGQEAYADIRNEKLGAGDGYLLVYAINDDTSFEKLDHIREMIMKEQDKEVPVFLIGTKSDLVDQRAVTKAEANAKKSKWGEACEAHEVSAMTGEGIPQVFENITARILATTADSTKGAGGGSVFAGGVASNTPEAQAAAQRTSRPCSIL